MSVTLGQLMEERKDAIVERWEDAVLSAYPADSAALFRAQRDPFANPLGHSVREGTRGVFQAILDKVDPESLRGHLDGIVRIRAVQELSPSEALSFVFSLRAIIREVIPEAEAHHREGLEELDRSIDEVALTAFELYAARRDELSQLRINEVKRQVAWVFEKMRGREEEAGEMFEDSNQQTSASDNAQREDL
ncbi:MAG: RsbRD N-terminal domain-containing protein [Gemmatimonadota bacterium]|jgi:hypothetical protein